MGILEGRRRSRRSKEERECFGSLDWVLRLYYDAVSIGQHSGRGATPGPSPRAQQDYRNTMVLLRSSLEALTYTAWVRETCNRVLFESLLYPTEYYLLLFDPLGPGSPAFAMP